MANGKDGMRVLVADNDYMSRHIIMQMFSDRTMEVSYVETEEKIWEFLNSKPSPRLLILDARMPGFNVIEMCRKIRESSDPRYVYIILTMPPSNLMTLLTALEAGADEFITKPLNRDELRARVRVARRQLEKEDQISRINQAWRTMIDTLPFGVACLGRNDEFLRVNKILADLLGHNLKDIVGKNILSTTFRRANDLARIRDAIRKSEAFDWVEMEVYHKSGSKQTLVVWGRPINDGDMVFQIVTATE